MNLAVRLGGAAVSDASRVVERESPTHRRDLLFESLHSDVVEQLSTQAWADLDRDAVLAKVSDLERALATRGINLAAQEHEQLVLGITDEMVGLGPLEALLADVTINDILVNGSERVYVERQGILERTAIRFRSDEHLLNTIKRIVAALGRRIDESSPMVDARLADGSRVNAIIPPLAIDGPVLSIRRFANGPTSFKELHKMGAVSAEMSHYFRSAVRAGANILVCGGTGAGKTTLLNALSMYIPSRERVVTIEDSAELRLQQEHVVRLEARPANMEGRGAVSIRDLVRNALRMRPDRIIVGEVRAEEVFDMVQAMNTGHDGSMTTIHASSAHDAFHRLLAMMSMSGTPLSEDLMRQLLVRAIDVVVHVARGSDGRRRIEEVVEVVSIEAGEVRLHPVFRFEYGRKGEGDEDPGHWVSSGETTLAERFVRAGVPLDERVLRGDA